jgi:hypothetical protein
MKMSIVCPLCGRHVPENVFDPGNFKDDIYAVEVIGLGRGRGFAVTETYSIQDPLILGLIKDRCHRILHLVDNRGYLPPQEIGALRALLEQWVQYARKLESENEELKEEFVEDEYEDEYEDYEDYEEYVDRLLEKINRETSFQWESLEDAINFLLEA